MANAKEKIMEEHSQRINYDDGNFREFMAQFRMLSTFAAVESWDRQAQTEVERILGVIRGLDMEMAQQAQTVEQLRQSKSEKSLMGRLLSSGKEEKELTQRIEKYREYKTTLGKMASQLQESIDFTPNSPEEQKVLLKELRQRKKELQVEKREIAATMKAVRTDARQQSAQAGRVFGVFHDSKLAAIERRSIRYSKESALRPHEDAKATIERQLVQVDRDILWAEKFQ
jgi:vacuolar-type H+-ATPase subunit I/STV1